MLRVYCPGCGKLVRGGDDWAGVTGCCPNCKSEIRFPKSAISCDEEAALVSVVAERAVAIESRQTAISPFKTIADRFPLDPQDADQITARLTTDLKEAVASTQSEAPTNGHLKSARGYILNCIPSKKNPKKDWRIENVREAGLLEAPPIIPDSKDLREPWWTIGWQKSTGSCVGWAIVDGVLRWHFVKAGLLSEDDRLSARYIWMAAKELEDWYLARNSAMDEEAPRPNSFIESDGVLSLGVALEIAQKYGIVRDAILPFDSDELYAGSAQAFYTLAAQMRIASYHDLGTDTRDWREWLATTGPILTSLDVDDTWYNAFNTGGKLDVYQKPPEPAGHAIALVGYTPETFIVRNSWGPDWGDLGFGYASEEYARAAFREAFGVKVPLKSTGKS